jgi:hypothetical protein
LLEALMLPTEDAVIKQLDEARKQYASRIEALIKAAGDALDESEQKQLRYTGESLRDSNPPEAMRFGRIVLYIDDLDRCDPDKVVQVLQAVNMLPKVARRGRPPRSTTPSGKGRPQEDERARTTRVSGRCGSCAMR